MDARERRDRGVRALLRRRPACGDDEVDVVATERDPRGDQPRGVPGARARGRRAWRSACSRARRRRATATSPRSTRPTLRRRRRARPRRRLDAARARRATGSPASCDSWRLGAVRMTERFLPDDGPQAQAARRAARPRRAQARARRRGSAGAERLVGIGGTVRNLAAALQRALERARVRRAGLRASSATRSTTSSTGSPGCRSAERRRVPGIKPERGDIILAGAVVVQPVLEAGGFDGDRGDRGGPARGRLLRARARRPRARRCSTTCARASVLNLAAQYDPHARAHAPRRRARARRSSTSSPRPACTTATPPSASCCGPRHAARHRRRGRLRRPPQALALPDPQRRPAGVHAARGRADRPGRPLPPQGHARRRAVRPRSCATATRRCSTAAPCCCGSPRISSAAATRPCARRTSRGGDDDAIRLDLVADGEARVPRWAASRETELFARAFGRELQVV